MLLLGVLLGGGAVTLLDLLYAYLISYRTAVISPIVITALQGFLKAYSGEAPLPSISPGKIYGLYYLLLTCTGIEAGLETPLGSFFMPIKTSLFPHSIIHILLMLGGGAASAWYRAREDRYLGLGDCILSGALTSIPVIVSVLLVGLMSRVSLSLEIKGIPMEIYVGVYRIGIPISLLVSAIFGAAGGAIYRFVKEKRAGYHGGYY